MATGAAVFASWASLIAHVLGRAYRAFLLVLLVAAIVPTLWSWSSLVVRTGSMEPQIAAGDVVIAQPFSASQQVPLGRVVVFPNPAKPGDDELLVHRVVENLGGGEYATAGDANSSYDAEPVTADDVVAQPRLLVPWVGRPLVWFAEGRPLPLVAWGALTLVALVLASGKSGGKRGSGGRGASKSSTSSDGPPRHERLRPAAALALVVAAGMAFAGTQTATASFTDRTVSPSNTWAVSDSLAHRVSLASPGAVVRGLVPLTATISNTGVNDDYVVRMEYALPGTSTWAPACTKTAKPYSCSWATTGIANRTYDLRAVATSDTTTLTSDVVEDVLVDNLAPSVTMQNPGSPLRGTATFAATATDAHSGVARVVIQYAVAGSSTYQGLCTDTSAPYSCQFNTTTLANGTYSFRAVATDVAGTSTTSAAVTNRVVDNVVTTVVMTDPGENLRGYVTVRATASSTAGIASVRIQGAPAGTGSWGDVCIDTTSPYSCTYNTYYLADGLYDLRAIATDRAGGTTTSAVVANRRVDNTAPRAYDVQTTNGNVSGKLDTGDSMSLTYNELMKTTSFSSGWDGSAVAVTLRLRDGNSLGLGSTGDTVDILRSGSPVYLGAVNLRQDYISNWGTAQFNATMTASTTTVNGVTATRVTITVGTLASGSVRTVSTASAMTWVPSSLATDLGGLGTNTTMVTESGTSDRQF